MSANKRLFLYWYNTVKNEKTLRKCRCTIQFFERLQQELTMRTT